MIMVLLMRMVIILVFLRRSDRLEALSETVDYWMKNKSDKLIEVVELYY